MKVQPYLFFDGHCDEALAFYGKALGAEVTVLMRYKDSPEPAAPGMLPPGFENKVMHANFSIGETQLMASDGRSSGQPRFEGVSLTITAADVAEGERVFAALAEGGKVQMPMAPSFFAKRFGMVADRFGVSWMVIAGATAA